MSLDCPTKLKAVLLAGGSGYAGQFLAEHFIKSGFAVFLTFNSTPIPQLSENSFKVCFMTGEGFSEMFERIVKDYELIAVVNLAAISRPQDCEKDSEGAEAINVPTHLVSEMKVRFPTASSLPLFVHFSTDQVYSGDKGSLYTEEDATDAINKYGLSKVAAERFVSQSLSNYVILRTSLIYGPTTPYQPVAKPLFLKFIADQLRSLSPCTFFTDEWRCPVFVGDIVKAVDHFVCNASPGQDLKLVLNVGGPERLSRFDMAKAVAKFIAVTNDKLIPGSASSVNRGFVSPIDTSVDSTKLWDLLKWKTSRLEDNLEISLS